MHGLAGDRAEQTTIASLLDRFLSFVPESLSQRLRGISLSTVTAVSLFLFLTLLYFWPFVLKGEIIAPADLLLKYPPWSSLATDDFHVKNVLRSDVVDARLPSLNYYGEAITEGEFPLWAPLWSQGRPFASQLLKSFFHPLTAIAVLLPVSYGFSLLTMSKFFLAALFMYLFLRRLGVGQAGSLLGGIAYMFGGFNIVWLMWSQTTVSAFAPLLFLQTENLLRKPTLGNSALLSLVIAIMVLGGFPAVAGYFFYAAGLYFIVRSAEIVLKGRLGWRMTWSAGAFGLSFALAAGLVAFQALPTLEFADFVDIAGQRSELSRGSFPIKQGLQLVFPNFFGNQVFGHELRGVGNLNETSGYVGIVTLILALFGVLEGLRRRLAPPVFFGALALLSVLIVYRDTGPLRSLVNELPVFNLNPNTRTLSVFGFGAAAAAAFGLDYGLQFRPAGWLERAAPLALTGSAAVLAGVVAFLAFGMTERKAFLSDLLDDFPLLDIHALSQLDFESFRLATVAFGLVLVMVFVVLAALYFRRVLPRGMVAAGVLAIVAADLFVFAYRQNPTVPNSYFYPETPAIEFLDSRLLPYERMAPFDGTFMIPGTQAYYGLSSAFSHGLHSKRQRDLILAFSDDAFVSRTAVHPKSAQTRFDSPIIDLLGVRYLTFRPTTDPFEAQPAAEAEYELVYSNPEEIRIYENMDFAPAFLVGDVELAAPSQILQRLSSGRLDPHTLAYIEELPPPEWTAAPTSPANSISSVTVGRYDSSVVTYEVETANKALLVTPELDYPGWTAYVDGERTEIFRTDYVFRGVFLSAGQHEVKFSYRPSSFRVGAIISFVSIGVVVAMLLADLAWRRRRTRLEDVPRDPV
jgi:hypothetical protein